MYKEMQNELPVGKKIEFPIFGEKKNDIQPEEYTIYFDGGRTDNKNFGAAILLQNDKIVLNILICLLSNIGVNEVEYLSGKYSLEFILGWLKYKKIKVRGDNNSALNRLKKEFNLIDFDKVRSDQNLAHHLLEGSKKFYDEEKDCYKLEKFRDESIRMASKGRGLKGEISGVGFYAIMRFDEKAMLGVPLFRYIDIITTPGKKTIVEAGNHPRIRLVREESTALGKDRGIKAKSFVNVNI